MKGLKDETIVTMFNAKPTGYGNPYLSYQYQGHWYVPLMACVPNVIMSHAFCRFVGGKSEQKANALGGSGRLLASYYSKTN